MPSSPLSEDRLLDELENELRVQVGWVERWRGHILARRVDDPQWVTWTAEAWALFNPSNEGLLKAIAAAPIGEISALPTIVGDNYRKARSAEGVGDLATYILFFGWTLWATIATLIISLQGIIPFVDVSSGNGIGLRVTELIGVTWAVQGTAIFTGHHYAKKSRELGTVRLSGAEVWRGDKRIPYIPAFRPPPKHNTIQYLAVTNQTAPCHSCRGSGHGDTYSGSCGKCAGIGRRAEGETCMNCGGTGEGKVERTTCPECRGSGVVALAKYQVAYNHRVYGYNLGVNWLNSAVDTLPTPNSPVFAAVNSQVSRINQSVWVWNSKIL